LQESLAVKLANFVQLKALSPHPLLELQTNEKASLRWVHCAIRAEGNNNWIRGYTVQFGLKEIIIG